MITSSLAPTLLNNRARSSGLPRIPETFATCRNPSNLPGSSSIAFARDKLFVYHAYSPVSANFSLFEFIASGS